MTSKASRNATCSYGYIVIYSQFGFYRKRKDVETIYLSDGPTNMQGITYPLPPSLLAHSHSRFLAHLQQTSNRGFLTPNYDSTLCLSAVLILTYLLILGISRHDVLYTAQIPLFFLGEVERGGKGKILYRIENGNVCRSDRVIY